MIEKVYTPGLDGQYMETRQVDDMTYVCLIRRDKAPRAIGGIIDGNFQLIERYTFSPEALRDIAELVEETTT